MLVMPSSSCSRRVVLAPTPGSRMTSTSPGGNCASRLLEGRELARREQLVDLRGDGVADVLELRQAPLAGQPLDRLAGLPEPRPPCDRPARGTRRRRRARRDRRAGRRCRPGRHSAAPRWAIIPAAVRAAPDSERFLLCLPTYDERENLPRMIAPWRRSCRRRDPRRRAGHRRRLAGRDGQHRRRAGGHAPVAARAAPARQEAGSAAHTWQGSAGRWRTGTRTSSRWTATSPTIPRVVPRLIDTAGAGADIVLGSRYVEGGGTVNWGLVRRLISSGGCLYARLVLGLQRPRPHRRLQVLPPRRARGDRPRRRARRGLRVPDRDDVPRPRCSGFRVVEVPIVFTDRVAGGSKMSRRIVAEAAWRVPLLRLRALLGRIPSRRRPDRA